jgi:hypothetical protein
MKAEVRKMGGISTLVKLLDNADPDVKKNCALALSVCIEDFANRTEIRHVKGLRPLIDLLTSEHSEVQELALKCLSRCSEDHSNVVELSKLMMIRKILDFLVIDSNEHHFYLALVCLSFQLDESDSVQIFVECNGLGPLMKLINHGEVPIRKQSSICLSKALKFERNQIAAKELGLLPAVVQQLGSTDPATSSAACIVSGALAKNGTF